LDLHEKKAEILAMMVDTKTGVPLCGDQKDVFLANAAVSWLMEHTTAKTRDDAVEFCRDLANRRVIESVDKGKDFTDSDDKFRFVSTTMEDVRYPHCLPLLSGSLVSNSLFSLIGHYEDIIYPRLYCSVPFCLFCFHSFSCV
jgi:hypothetical protein